MGPSLHLCMFVIIVWTLTEGNTQCRRSTSTSFAATHHHGNKKHGHHSDSSSATGRKNAAGTSREKRQDVTCDSSYVYRSMDGTCNNLNQPSWGSAGQTYRRLLDPVYDDGKTLPRLKQENGDSLPSPRSISVVVHNFDVQRLHTRGSVMLMEWGQFLAHDIIATPLDDASLTEQCCYEELVTGSDLHPNVTTGGPCFPIIIEDGDRYFTQVSTRCMEFVRSLPVTDANSVRQQQNDLSAYIDGTNVYGGSDDDMKALRTLSGGKLAMTADDQLTKSDDNYCLTSDDGDYCMEAGDDRVNVYPGLGALHVLFARYHNYVADQLAASHSDYDDETLFQEARKIIIAVLQRITYNEYLPMIVGSSAISTYGLSDTWAYDDSCDATLYNVFATAAFRFGHSMVPDALLIDNTNYSSVNLFNRPHHVLTNLDSLLTGLTTEPAERADRWYSLGMTDQLFEETAQNGYDIVSLNIQRGRDHGIAPYNKWRDQCGLASLGNLSEIDSPRIFQQAYNDVDDVDLYSGALAETPVATVGPTYACLLGMQFKNLRNCDRFWWENTDSTIGFANNRARAQIKKTRLSHVICLTTGITSIQQSVMRQVESGNELQTCASLLSNGADYSLL